jgi:uncharacterized protein
MSNIFKFLVPFTFFYFAMIAIGVAGGPSFDCNKARSPDEIAICASPELADLDNQVARGYAYVKSTQGGQSADALGIPLWRARQGCGADPDCIRQRQIQAILAYQAAGAPVSVPDPRLAGASPSQAFSYLALGPSSQNFVVDGVTLGSIVDPESAAYKSRSCRSSQDFSAFTWCSEHVSKTGRFGQYTSWLTILYSGDDKVALVTQALIPAFFFPSDIDREIQRLSRGFGQAQILTSDSRPGVPHAVLATWGAVTLTPLDEEAMNALRRGDEIHRGLIAEFIGDAHKSARLGLPVYSIGGGPGFLWGASFDDSGKGSLRISAVDANAVGFSQMPPATAPPTVSSTPLQTLPAPAVPSAEELARRERARADHLDKIFQAATKQLNYVAQFITEHPKNSRLLDYLDETAALKAAVEKGDPDDIERKSTTLAGELTRDQNYQQFDAERAKEQKVTEAQGLSDAIRRAQVQRAFLIDYVTKNPLASEIANLLPLIKQLDRALERPSLDPLQRLVGQIDLAIREANLDEAFRAAQADRARPTLETEVGRNGADQGSALLPHTDKNRFLLEGDLNDVLALYNASTKAPHVALNLRGQFVFADARANVCLFGDNPDGVALIIRSALAPYSIKTVTGLDQPCDPQNLEAYDVVVTQRGAFLKTARAEALALIKEVEIDAMRQFALISASEIAAASAAEHAAVEQIASDVAAGARNGFGVVLLKSKSPNLCVVTPEKTDAHEQLILRNADKLTFDMHVAPTLAMKSAEDSFVAAQKSQCGAVYASASDLKTISEGLVGAGIPFSFSSLWIAPAEVDAKDAELAEKKRLDAQQSFERRRKADDEARLRDQRDKDVAKTQSEEQLKLRAKYDGPAKAAVAVIVADVMNWDQSQRGPVGVEYPEFAAWLAATKADHWEIMTTDSDVQDYGTSDLKGRALDTAFARVTIRLRNPILGEYKDACFVFGRVADREFGMMREPVAARCEDVGGVKLWQTDHAYQSRWVVGDQELGTAPRHSR